MFIFSSNKTKIAEFHKAVEKNDYHAARLLFKLDMRLAGDDDEFELEDLFYTNLIESRKKVPNEFLCKHLIKVTLHLNINSCS